MKSIAQSARSGQGQQIRVYPSGIHIDSHLRGIRMQSRNGALTERKRGTIEGFSTAARRRMREAMLTLFIPDGRLVGVTFTVPWKGKTFDCLMDEFRECLHRFGVAFRRKFPTSALIYRVELQKRGAPHIHGLLWFSASDAAAAGWHACRASLTAVESVVLNWEIGALWRGSVPDLHHGSLSAFEKRGVLVEEIEDNGAMYRYLADHASKKKQAQLGYKGKQWGIIGQSNLVKRPSVRLPDFVSAAHSVCFFRLLRKVMRYRLQSCRHKWKRIPPFGSVLKGSRRTVGDFYLRQETVNRMWAHSLELSKGVCNG